MQDNRIVGEAGGANRWIREEVKAVMQRENLPSINKALQFLLLPYEGSIREGVRAVIQREKLASVNEALYFLLLRYKGFVPLHKRPVSELEAMLEKEPRNKMLRSALLAARAGVE